jgi:WD40 repeat protein
VAFTPDGAHVAAWRKSGRRLATRETGYPRLLIWNAATGEPFAQFGENVAFVVFGPASRGPESHGQSIWKRFWQSAPAAAQPSGANFRALVGSADGKAWIFDIRTGAMLLALNGHEGRVNCGAFCQDGSRIVTGSSDQTARVWDTVTGDELRVFQGDIGFVARVSFNSSGTRVLLGSQDVSDDGRWCSAQLWDIATGQEIVRLQGHRNPRIFKPYTVTSATFSPDESRILTASDNGIAHIWDADGKELCTIEVHQTGVKSAIFGPDGGQILAAGGRVASLWNAADGNLIRTLKGHTDDILSAAFSPDGARVLTTAIDGTVRIWNKDAGGPIAALGIAVVHPDRQHVEIDVPSRLWGGEANRQATDTSVDEGLAPDHVRLKFHGPQGVVSVLSAEGRHELTAETNPADRKIGPSS